MMVTKPPSPTAQRCLWGWGAPLLRQAGLVWPRTPGWVAAQLHLHAHRGLLPCVLVGERQEGEEGWGTRAGNQGRLHSQAHRLRLKTEARGGPRSAERQERVPLAVFVFLWLTPQPFRRPASVRGVQCSSLV